MKRAAAAYAGESFGLSKQRACWLVSLHRSTAYYVAKKRDDDAIRKRLRELAAERRRSGSPTFHAILQREGLVRNHKRTERIYGEENLSIRLRKRPKRAAIIRVPLPCAEKVNQSWSIDFVADRLESRRRFRVLTIVDNYSRECPALEVDTSIGGVRVVRVLDRLAETRGLPEAITLDNGPEFVSHALDAWAYRTGVRLNFIRPGKPVENAYAESFNGRLRDECLNGNWFGTLKEAREVIEGWRIDYNDFRPHGSLGYKTPSEFAKNAAHTWKLTT